jgi:hypothetical protein
MEFNISISLTMQNSMLTMCAAEKLAFSGVSLICHATQPNKYMYFNVSVNNRLTQLSSKYRLIRYIWLQCFDPVLGHHQAYKTTLKV